MNRFLSLGIVVVASLLAANLCWGQPVPNAPVNPLAPVPLGVQPAPAPGPAPAPVEAQKTPALLAEKPRVPGPGDDELQRLLIERYNVALSALQASMAAYNVGTTTFGNLAEAHLRLLQAGLELSDKPADQIAMLERYLEYAKALEGQLKTLFELQVRGGETEKMRQATYYRLDAEIQLLRIKRKAGLAK